MRSRWSRRRAERQWTRECRLRIFAVRVRSWTTSLSNVSRRVHQGMKRVVQRLCPRLPNKHGDLTSFGLPPTISAIRPHYPDSHLPPSLCAIRDVCRKSHQGSADARFCILEHIRGTVHTANGVLRGNLSGDAGDDCASGATPIGSANSNSRTSRRIRGLRGRSVPALRNYGVITRCSVHMDGRRGSRNRPFGRRRRGPPRAVYLCLGVVRREESDAQDADHSCRVSDQVRVGLGRGRGSCGVPKGFLSSIVT